MNQNKLYLHNKALEVASRGLRSYPVPSQLELVHVEAFSLLFSQLVGQIVIAHPNHDLNVVLRPILGPRISYLISIGDYEESDLTLIARHCTKDDIVLDIGGGAGLTSALATKITGSIVHIVEPDKRLHDLLREQAKVNGGRVSVTWGCVTAKSKRKTAKLHLSNEVWFSSVKKKPLGRTKTVNVPIVSLNQLLSEVRPTVLFVDVEGSEEGLFDSTLTHHPRLIFIEIHTPIIGEVGTCNVLMDIVRLGYELHDMLCWTYVFKKVGSK